MLFEYPFPVGESQKTHNDRSMYSNFLLTNAVNALEFYVSSVFDFKLHLEETVYYFAGVFSMSMDSGIPSKRRFSLLL